MQKVIIAVLQENSHTEGICLFSNMRIGELSWQVAKRYNNHSILTWEEYEKNSQQRREQTYQWLKELGRDDLANRLPNFFESQLYNVRKTEWLTNNFCASFSRSLKNLKAKNIICDSVHPNSVELTKKGNRLNVNIKITRR